MMIFRAWPIIAISLLYALALAAPIDKSTSPEWNDKYIKAPKRFKVTRIKNCIYQLTFIRDHIDSRYSFAFEAVYNGTRKAVAIEPIQGGLPVSRTEQIFSNQSPTNRYTFDDAHVLSVHQFNDACSDAGAAPTAFRVRANLGCCYTYINDYRTAPIPVTAGRIPPVPKDVRVALSGNQYRVTWDGVSGATGYYALAAGTFDNSEVGDVNIITTVETGLDGRSASFNNRTTSVAVVAMSGDGIVSMTGRVPEVIV